MNKNARTTEERLSALRPSGLAQGERERAWEAIERRLVQAPGRPVISPLQAYNLFSKPMITALAILLSLSIAGGTAYASDSARPGDALFGVDRAIENIRLKLEGESGRNELRLKFASERLAEVESLIREKGSVRATGTISSIEADAFRNETVVKVEFEGGAQAVFTTESDTRTEVIADIAGRYDITAEAADKLLSFDVEDRESRTEDKRGRGKVALSSDAEARVSVGIEAAVALLEGISADAEADGRTELAARLDEVVGLLNANINTIENVRVDLKDDRLRVRFDGDVAASTTVKGNEKFEVKTSDGEVRVEIKNGGALIQVKSDSSGSNGKDGEDGSDGEDGEDGKPGRSGSSSMGASAASGTSVRSVTGAEAKIGAVSTSVKVEYNGGRSVFTTASDTREEIIRDILNRFPTMTYAQVNTLLRVETDNDADNADDNGWSGKDEKEEDERKKGSSDENQDKGLLRRILF